MLKSGKGYKHKKCLDAAIMVDSVLEETKDSLVVLVDWIAVSHPRHFLLSQDTIEIKRQDLHNWKEFQLKFR